MSQNLGEEKKKISSIPSVSAALFDLPNAHVTMDRMPFAR